MDRKVKLNLIDYQKEVIKDLERTKPLYCIYVQDAQITSRAKGNLPNELLLSLIYKYIIENYEVIRQYDRTFILAKKY